MIFHRLLATAIVLWFYTLIPPTRALAQLAAGHYRWVAMTSNDPLPSNLIGFGICRVAMHGGVHPGKLLSDIRTCNVGWGNSGEAYHQFEVFTGDIQGVWFTYRDGDSIPAQALSVGPSPGLSRTGYLIGGHMEDGTPIYVCRGFDSNIGSHIGKLVAQNCNVEYGGKELILSSHRELFELNPASVIDNP